jgi:glycosyltransferase involved in cell wall biosynthesis
MPGVDFSAELILVCNSLDAGGIERVVSTLANEWNRRGRRISVITLHDRERFYKLDPTIHHIVVEQQGTTWLSSFLRNGRDRLVKLRRLKPYMIKLLGSSIYYFFSEIIHRTHFILYLTFETLALRQALKRVESPVVVSFGTSVNVVTLKACKRLKKRVIISERNDPARLIQLWERLWRKHYRRAHLVTANTRTALRDISAFVEPNKLAFVPNPIVVGNSSGHRQRNGNGKAPAHARAPFILNVGRLCAVRRRSSGLAPRGSG